MTKAVGLGVSVTVVDHSLLQITSAGPLSQSLDIEYTVSNGEPTSLGRVTVVPVSAGQVQVPVAGPDTAVVRVGDVVTVPVLRQRHLPLRPDFPSRECSCLINMWFF